MIIQEKKFPLPINWYLRLTHPFAYFTFQGTVSQVIGFYFTVYNITVNDYQYSLQDWRTADVFGIFYYLFTGFLKFPKTASAKNLTNYKNFLKVLVFLNSIPVNVKDLESR